jgi:transcriptional regulator with XRE-family HTH domain
MSDFRWTKTTSAAAIALADGETQRAVAKALDISEKTVSRWMHEPTFGAEVDRLTLMMGIASRAERLRIAKRLIRQRVQDEHVESDKDLLDWLKFAQSETDGIKLDLATLAAFAASLAGGGPGGVPSASDRGAAAPGGDPDGGGDEGRPLPSLPGAIPE